MEKANPQSQPASVASAAPVEALLQRKCECGNHTIGGSGCSQCDNAAKQPEGEFLFNDSSGFQLVRKIAIGKSDDPMEIEADRVADEILRTGSGTLSRQTSPRIQRRAAYAGSSPAIAPPSVGRVLSSPGQPLSVALREEMEKRFNHDFSRVRVHSGAEAARSARDVNARAYTVGSTIVFGNEQFGPDALEGKRLLAHELTHVVQQSSGGAASVQRQTTVGQLPPAGEVDFKALADQIHDAIYRIGTDEEAVYRALEQLRQDPTMIQTLINTYARFHDGADLIADIQGDFSDTELEYAMQLLGRGKPGSEQRVVGGPAGLDLESAAKRIRAAVEIIGTDEEAIYATLRPFNRATKDLEQTYNFMYNETLRWRLNDEMSGDELKHALSLLSFDNEAFLEEHFKETQRGFARKILADIMNVKGNRLDFADDAELATEISKRMRTSELMQESQTFAAFGYPESCKETDCPGVCIGRGQAGEPGSVPPNINVNAHVNKDARDYWVKGPDAQNLYMFILSKEGWNDPYSALVKLFTPQDSICDKTLIHCDYLTTVIHHRAFAESIGKDEYNERVRRGEINVRLSYWGFRDVMIPVPLGSKEPGYAVAPGGVSLQAVQPASEDDLLIGDHVVFWNHLAYDALTASPTWSGPWRLENALLVDQDSSGKNLYEGHGAPTNEQQQIVKGNKERMLEDIRAAYDAIAAKALELTERVDANDPAALVLLRDQFPRLARRGAHDWWIIEIDYRPENASRRTRAYPLRRLSSINDPDLIGLRDPDDPSKMGWVKRPIESAPGRSPSRPK